MKKQHWIALSIVLVVAAIATYYYMTSEPTLDNDITAQQAPAPAAAPPRNAPNAGYPFQDTSMLKPPAGAKVAIFEFEDLECPACAQAFPIVHAVAAHYKIPLERHDYPWSFHIWSFDAAITARYIQDKLSPQLADDFRRDVFANQRQIASKDDLTRFTGNWFKSHGKTLPFVVDASGTCASEVDADRALGDRLGVKSTPCVIVVTQNGWTPVVDMSQLDRIVGEAVGRTASSSSSAAAPITLRATPART